MSASRELVILEIRFLRLRLVMEWQVRWQRMLRLPLIEESTVLPRDVASPELCSFGSGIGGAYTLNSRLKRANYEKLGWRQTRQVRSHTGRSM